MFLTLLNQYLAAAESMHGLYPTQLSDIWEVHVPGSVYLLVWVLPRDFAMSEDEEPTATELGLEPGPATMKMFQGHEYLAQDGTQDLLDLYNAIREAKIGVSTLYLHRNLAKVHAAELEAQTMSVSGLKKVRAKTQKRFNREAKVTHRSWAWLAQYDFTHRNTKRPREHHSNGLRPSNGSVPRSSGQTDGVNGNGSFNRSIHGSYATANGSAKHLDSLEHSPHKKVKTTELQADGVSLTFRASDHAVRLSGLLELTGVEPTDIRLKETVDAVSSVPFGHLSTEKVKRLWIPPVNSTRLAEILHLKPVLRSYLDKPHFSTLSISELSGGARISESISPKLTPVMPTIPGGTDPEFLEAVLYPEVQLRSAPDPVIQFPGSIDITQREQKLTKEAEFISLFGEVDRMFHYYPKATMRMGPFKPGLVKAKVTVGTRHHTKATWTFNPDGSPRGHNAGGSVLHAFLRYSQSVTYVFPHKNYRTMMRGQCLLCEKVFPNYAALIGHLHLYALLEFSIDMLKQVDSNNHVKINVRPASVGPWQPVKEFAHVASRPYGAPATLDDDNLGADLWFLDWRADTEPYFRE